MKGFWQQVYRWGKDERLRRPPIKKQERLVDYSLVEMAALLRAGELTSRQITLAYLARIDRLNGPFEIYNDNGGYNAFVRIDREQALVQSDEADAWINNPEDPRGPAPLLCGIPVGVKDSIGIVDRESKNGAPEFSTNVALRDATAVARLRDAGAVVLGHTICSRFSGSTHGDFGCNAWDLDKVPGGSSSGSAIAPVARLCVATLGEETGGSMIIPAAANGASAIKPSLGYVSTGGVMPLRIGWDVVGPMARSVQDAAHVLAAIQGPDPDGDPQTLHTPLPFPPMPTEPRPGAAPLTGLTIGIPQTDWMTTSAVPPAQTYDADYSAAFERFKVQLQQLGARVIEFAGVNMADEVNCLYYAGPILWTIENPYTPVTPAMATTYCQQYEANYWQAVEAFAAGRPEADQETLLRYYGTKYTHPVVEQLPCAVRIEAEQRRRQQMALWQDALNVAGVDFMMVLPLGAHVGFRQGMGEPSGLQNQRSYYDLPNALGWPMVTFPIGHGRTGIDKRLPINAAFWGPRFSDPRLVQAAMDYQHHHPEYHREAPEDPPLRRPVALAQPFWPVSRESSTDPLVKEGSLRP
ncbi:Amidase [Pseudomonas sp. NFACC02]|uniref:amidase n=1 Tax=Pseudomonas TaxID=286 RepID=UPI000785CF96|nr:MULTISPECIES: amidase [Pseudomonas]SER75994.1 Amidase [Pseudomonas sp. NFACC02]